MRGQPLPITAIKAARKGGKSGGSGVSPWEASRADLMSSISEGSMPQPRGETLSSQPQSFDPALDPRDIADDDPPIRRAPGDVTAIPGKADLIDGVLYFSKPFVGDSARLDCWLIATRVLRAN